MQKKLAHHQPKQTMGNSRCNAPPPVFPTDYPFTDRSGLMASAHAIMVADPHTPVQTLATEMQDMFGMPCPQSNEPQECAVLARQVFDVWQARVLQCEVTSASPS